MAKKMSPIDWIAYILIVVGAINWGLIGALNFNLVQAIGIPMVETIVYIAVGVAGIYAVYTGIKLAKK